MPDLSWQKSSFSGGESEDCLYLAAAPDGTVRLRESDSPDEIITTTPAHLGHLVRALKSRTAP
ncbi:DUF397 domain-containing protein [Streptomyces griseoruber]|uniref:DUF397 domain-containing protein n=1 Tax=Streptomyces griseoruber TaxID=1943 RepID=A0A101SIV6_9ACTN|nr:DUF397 domain-containing protein [Streptomyces griseoruber]KUN75050.1 hypothetical protein AQJ64_44165 [Streptomyces griseoruber]